MTNKVIIIGAGGHGKVIADIVEKNGDRVYGYLDDGKENNSKIYKKYKVIGKISDCECIQSKEKNLKFIIAIGDNSIRKEIYNMHKLDYYTAIDPNAIIADSVKIGKGTAIMANVCINADAKIGENCIVNTASVIEHDCVIEDNVHISSNVSLGGTVKIGESSYIGIGTVIKNNININKMKYIEAGTIILQNVN